MIVLNPIALNRADLERLGKYLVANDVQELKLIRKDGLQIMTRQAGGWCVTKSEVV